MKLSCHFSTCQWCGPEDDIVEHLVSKHRKFLREPKGNLYFDFSHDELQQETYVLCTSRGLYWFRKNQAEPRSDGLDFAVFHIGESQQVEYILQLDLKSEDHCEYWGPFPSEQDDMMLPAKDVCIPKEDLEYLEFCKGVMPVQRLRVLFW